jgi:formate dehydrogenase iron-sulfur subunit
MGIPDPDPIKCFVTKCDLCAERERDDLLPACVELCPTGAIRYGEYDEVVKGSKSRSLKLLKDKKLLLKKSGGG